MTVFEKNVRMRIGAGAGVLAVLLLVCLFTGPARAETEYKLYFDCPSARTQTRVTARVSNGNYTVFLPGYWDASEIRVTFEKPDEIAFGDLVVHSGDTVDLSGLLNEKTALKRNGGHRFAAITFYQGSPLTTVQIQVDAKELKRAIKDKHVVIPEGTIVVTNPDGTVAHEGGLIQFKGRGNATYNNLYTKKPFQFKLAEKADLGGMGKSRTWLLIANYLDISLLRNQINLDLAREMGMRGAVECVQADVWLNDAYYGLYLLTEKVQINKNRVDIRNLEEETEELNELPLENNKKFKAENKKEKTEYRGYEIPNDPEDITGGYIIELDKPYRYKNSAVSGFVSSAKLYFVIKEPTAASRAQSEYISGLFEKFLRGVKADDGVDPVSGEYYADLINMESFAMKFLVEDFAKNYDALAGSQFFFKDSDAVDPRIYAGPCWDYDLCMGNIDIAGIGSGLYPQKSWAVNIKNGKVNWYALLYKHPDFQEEVRRVYREKFRPALAALIGEEGAEGRIVRRLEDYEAEIADSARMNFVRISAKGVPGINSKAGRTFESATRFLFNWARERVADMDGVYGR